MDVGGCRRYNAPVDLEMRATGLRRFRFIPGFAEIIKLVQSAPLTGARMGCSTCKGRRAFQLHDPFVPLSRGERNQS
jgi:hypothetical protein